MTVDSTPERRLRDIDDLPGPRGAWPWGNLLQIERPRIHRSVEAWSRAHGPLMRMRFGRRRILVVADPELITGVLRDRPDGFRRMQRLREIWREMGLPTGLFGAERPTWRHQRRMVMAAFDPAHVQGYFASLARVAERLHGRWLKAARAGSAIDLRADLMRYTVDAISGLAFGVDTNTLESDGDVIQRHLDRLFPTVYRRTVSPLPTWRWWPSAEDRRLAAGIVEIKAAIDGFIAQARAALTAEPTRRDRPANLLEAMLVAADRADSGVGPDDVAGNVLTMLLAGEDTTANTLAWMLHLLWSHSDALVRARDEVRAGSAAPRPINLERLDALDWLGACVHETMRLKPVAPFMTLEALHDTAIGDVSVPAGTLVWCVLRAGSLDARHFPDPEEFDPRRWLGAGAPRATTSSAKRVSMPFGAGPRICPGRYLALLEIKLAVTMLLDRFDIVDVSTPDGRPPAEHFAFTMAPEGLRMRLRKRGATA